MDQKARVQNSLGFFGGRCENGVLECGRGQFNIAVAGFIKGDVR